MFALGKIDAKLSLILTRTCAKKNHHPFSFPARLIRSGQHLLEALQAGMAAVPYILNWSLWIASFAVAFWKWLMPLVRSLSGF